MRQRNARPIQGGLILLFIQLANIGLDHIPPVALSVLGACIALYLDFLPLKWIPASASAACLSFHHIFPSGSFRPQWNRLLWAPLFHGDDFHLYYNMISWVWKARGVELYMGSEFMLLLVLVGWVLSEAFYLLLCFGAQFLSMELMYLFQPNACAVGFSGILFFLKTVYTFENCGQRDAFMGILPGGSGKYAVWIELLYIQLISHNVSFTGHLAGILAGLLYQQLHMTRRLRAAADTLKDWRLANINPPRRR